jgi:surface antigen
MKPGRLAVVMIQTLCLSGCMGAGLLAKTGANDLFGKTEKPPAERIATAQESAISAAHGGTSGTPIAWSDAPSGLEGALVPDRGGDNAESCRHYQQTVILAGETLQGQIAACSQQDGSWKLASGPRKTQQ